MKETTDDPILTGLPKQRLVPRAEAGEFSGPGAHATVFERVLGALVTGDDEALEQALAIATANEEAGIEESRVYSERLSWTVN